MSSAVLITLITTIGGVLTAALAVILNGRNERAKNAIQTVVQDAAVRVEEWDRLLKNCRTEADRKAIELDTERKLHDEEIAHLRAEIDYYRTIIARGSRGNSDG